MTSLVHEALAIADSSPDARDLVPVLTELVTLVREHPAQEPAATGVFLSLFAQSPPYVVLGAPGVVGILEFSMHHLRLPAVRTALTELTDSAADWRVSRAAARVLEAFDDAWEDGDIYDVGGGTPQQRGVGNDLDSPRDAR